MPMLPLKMEASALVFVVMSRRFLPLLKPKRPWRIVVGLTAPAAKEASALACKETPFNTMCLYSYGACQLATL